MADFEILFSGLCAFLISEEKKRATVLLVEHGEHPHRPQLIIDLGDLADPDQMKHFPQYVGHVGWIDIGPGTDIHLKRAGEEPGHDDVTFEAIKDKPVKCPQGANMNNLPWLVNLNHLTARPSQPTSANRHPFPATSQSESS